MCTGNTPKQRNHPIFPLLLKYWERTVMRPPEYIATGRLTVRCDVYSFGVVLLELLSGRRAVDKTKVGVEQNLWARPCLGYKRKLFRIMDTKLEGQYPLKGAYMAAVLALECLGDAKNRPSMPEVLARLEKIPVPKVTLNPDDRSDRLQSISSTPSPSPRTPHRHQHNHHHRRPPSDGAVRAAPPLAPQTKSTLSRCTNEQ